MTELEQVIAPALPGAQVAKKVLMTIDQIARRVSLAFVIAVALLCIFLPRGVFAQEREAGVRLGVSASPDQFYFGGHYDTGYLIEHVSFRPNLELGFGDNRTTVAANFEFAYWFPVNNKPYTVYVGGGPALNVFRYDLPAGTTTSAKPGFNLLAGAVHQSGLFAELKLGLIDSPVVRFGVGYSWRWR
jgi:hypothetical protein